MGIKLLSFFILLIAYLNPISVLAQCPSSVSISANTGNSICTGTEVTFTANVNGGDSSTFTYQWKVGTSDTGTNSNVFKSSTLSNGQKVKVVVSSSDATCSNVTSTELTMVVLANRNPTASISSNKTSICPGENITFTANNTDGGSNPQYAFFINGTTAAAQTGTSNIFSSSDFTSGNNTVRVVLTSNYICLATNTAEATINTINVKAGIPAKPGAISGSGDICPGISGTYSIANVSDATEYIWTLPSGWSGSSTSNSINVTSGNNSGTISVAAKNSCGTSEVQTLSVTIKPGTPTQPGTISGSNSVCPGVSETYSIAAVTGANSYIWTLPNGWTGTSTTNSIDLTTGKVGS